jgi:hypothetical protein
MKFSEITQQQLDAILDRATTDQAFFEELSTNPTATVERELNVTFPPDRIITLVKDVSVPEGARLKVVGTGGTTRQSFHSEWEELLKILYRGKVGRRWEGESSVPPEG